MSVGRTSWVSAFLFCCKRIPSSILRVIPIILSYTPWSLLSAAYSTPLAFFLPSLLVEGCCCERHAQKVLTGMRRYRIFTRILGVNGLSTTGAVNTNESVLRYHVDPKLCWRGKESSPMSKSFRSFPRSSFENWDI
jgi:hypothetical protein